MATKSYEEICSIINNEIEYNAAGVHIISGENLICIDIPSILNVTLSKELGNNLCNYSKEEIISSIYLNYPSLKFFDKNQIINYEKEEVLNSVKHNDLIQRVKLIEEEKIVPEDIDIKISNRVDIENGIRFLNQLLKKNYICYSKRGILINISSYYNRPFDTCLEEFVMSISDIDSAKQVLYEIIKKYPVLKIYQVDYNEDSTSKEEKIEEVKLSNEQIEALKVYEDTLTRVNEKLAKPLYFNNNCRLAYKYKQEIGKKKKKKTIVTEVELNSKLQDAFKIIKEDMDFYYFLMLLHESNPIAIFNRPPAIINDYIYIKDYGYVLNNMFLERILSLNSNFTKDLIKYTEKGIYVKGIRISDPILNNIYINSNAINEEEEKKLYILKTIVEFYNIKNEEFIFKGSYRLIKNSDKLFNEALAVINNPIKILTKTKLKSIEDLEKYKEYFKIQNINSILKYKYSLDLGEISPDTIDKAMYMTTIDIKHKLFNLTVEESHGEIISDIKYNNSLIYDIEQIPIYLSNKSVSLLRKLKKFCKDIKEVISKKILDSVENNDKYAEFNLKELAKNLKSVDLFSQYNIKMTKEKIKVFDKEYKYTESFYEIYKTITEETYKYLMSAYNNKIIEWDLILEAKRDIEKLAKINEYAAALYVVNDIKLKGMTTYIDILAGKCTSAKNVSEYSRYKIYGYLSNMTKPKIEEVINKLVSTGVLDKVRRRASFGNYIAIVTTNKFSLGMVKDFEDKLYGITNNAADESIEDSKENDKHSNIERFELDLESLLNEVLKDKLGAKYTKNKILKDARDVNKETSEIKEVEENKDTTKEIIQQEVDIMSFLNIIKNSTNINSIINNYKVSEINLKEIKDICKFAMNNKNFILANWEAISSIIPKLNSKALTFLNLQYNLNKKPQIKAILEIESMKEVI